MTEFMHHHALPAYTRLQEMPPPPPVPSGRSVVVNTAPPAVTSNVVVVNTAEPRIVNQSVPLVQSFSTHICIACLTFWCCGVVFGLIAFILAVLAQGHSTSLNESDRRTAHLLGKWSIGISLAGVLVGIIVAVLTVCLTLAKATD
jgi:hypothetical protein